MRKNLTRNISYMKISKRRQKYIYIYNFLMLKEKNDIFLINSPMVKEPGKVTQVHLAAKFMASNTKRHLWELLLTPRDFGYTSITTALVISTSLN